LEYDPALYQRDRGELDWDQRSIASTAMFGNAGSGDNTSLYHQNTHYHAGSMGGGRASPVPSAFDRYLAKGPSQSQSHIELTRMNQSVDQLPLLTDHQPYGYFDNRQQPPLPGYSSPDRMTPPVRYESPAPMATLPQMQYPPHPGTHRSPTEGYREAPLHRPYPPHRDTPSYSGESQSQNMAGRGSYRG